MSGLIGAAGLTHLLLQSVAIYTAQVEVFEKNLLHTDVQLEKEDLKDPLKGKSLYAIYST